MDTRLLWNGLIIIEGILVFIKHENKLSCLICRVSCCLTHETLTWRPVLIAAADRRLAIHSRNSQSL